MTITVHPVGADMFKVGAEVLVNPVNTVGVMGAGLAELFAKLYPAMNTEYKKRCEEGAENKLKVGAVYVYDTETTDPVAVANLPTKEEWVNPSEKSYVEEGVKALIKSMEMNNRTSVAIPALGCGLGGLKWDDVCPIIVAAFAKHPHITVHLFPPH